MLIIYDLTSGEVLDNTGTNSAMPDGPPGDLAYVNTDARGLDRDALGLVRLHDVDDAALVQQVLTREVTVDTDTGDVIVGDPLPDPLPAAPSAEQVRRVAAEKATQIVVASKVREGALSDREVADVVPLFEAWSPDGVAYEVGDVVAWDSTLVECLQAHTSQSSWSPDAAASLWTIHRQDGTGPHPWVQPTGAHDAYEMGDRVTHNGQTWEVTRTDAAGTNSWEPGVYGWTAR